MYIGNLHAKYEERISRLYEKTEGQTDKQTNKQTNKPTKQKDYTSPALAVAGDYN